MGLKKDVDKRVCRKKIYATPSEMLNEDDGQMLSSRPKRQRSGGISSFRLLAFTDEIFSSSFIRPFLLTPFAQPHFRSPSVRIFFFAFVDNFSFFQ